MTKKTVAFIHDPSTTVVLPATNAQSILTHQLAKRLVHEYFLGGFDSNKVQLFSTI